MTSGAGQTGGASGGGPRCHMCGYALVGLADTGTCPECGTPYTPGTANRLQPWPSAVSICVRLGWPIIGLASLVGLASVFSRSIPDEFGLLLIVLGWGLLIALPINSYFQVRSMLKRHLPHRTRTTGAVAVFRALGTTACILAFILIVLPAILLGACLVIMSGGGF